ncbi:pyridoxamine 5'-phosphate oxidase family protein [Klenkia terrae]|jgi:general stress protein 26|uniref:Pyridoxamine 5'-phosphate oxidase family protein n=1 Tax=Klenkia terrae TaxID=1052259 RepID=A0ABU8EBL6_9ACTN|nr:pyridoxamine 5'-phosphate oxidase family protein [Klenkia terrae]SSC25545.1 General stress protein, FMN-binding split barrel domain [Klenkia terrae]
MAEHGVEKVRELVAGEKIAMLTTLGADGSLESRPMSLQETEFDGDLWFFAEADGGPAKSIAANPKVNVTTGSRSSWVSIAGEGIVVTDVAKKKELWNSGAEAWLPQGPEDASVVLIKVDGSSAEYWDTPGAVTTAISFVKAKATGERTDVGENEKVVLP